MKKSYWFATLVCFSHFIALSQNKDYEKGYFIDNNNKRIECFIKNMEWNYTPTSFEYKTEESSAAQTMPLNGFKEFKVGGEYKFIKANVKIDKSDDRYENVTSSKTLNFVDQELLLRVRVEGIANLYSYKNERYTRFFYSIEKNKIEPLSYKNYYDIELGTNRKNETYKQELLNNLKCDKITQRSIEKLDYNDSSLYDFFIEYNNCKGVLTEGFVGQKNFNTFELAIKAGISVCDFTFQYGGFDTDFSNKTYPKAEVEAEINFSNKNKKWSAVLDLGFSQYSNSFTSNTTNPYSVDVDYKAIDFSVGLRTYFSLNSKSYLFINGGIIYGFVMNSKVDTNNSNDYKLTSSLTPVLGLGYFYNKKYSIEVNYELGRNLALNNSGIDSKLKVISLMIGYKFL